MVTLVTCPKDEEFAMSITAYIGRYRRCISCDFSQFANQMFRLLFVHMKTFTWRWPSAD